MVKAAILGYGTVGSGVAEVLSCNQELIAKRAGNPIWALFSSMIFLSFPLGFSSKYPIGILDK